MGPGALLGAPSTEHRTLQGGPAQLYLHGDLHVWTWAAAVMIAGELRRDLESSPRARLLLSPSDRAAPVLRALSKAPLDWARVDVGLVDERWLRPDDPDSHAASVRRHLLVDRAAAARMEPLTLVGRRIQYAVAIANAHARQAPDVVVLTMGDDGHVAALFPAAADFARALESRQDYIGFDASFCPTAAPWSRRITATPLGLSRAKIRVLLLRGNTQRAHLDAAIAATSPVSSLAAVLQAGGPPLLVHWCP